MTHDQLPDAPDSLPEYVAGPVERQSPEKLRALSAWAATLADAKADQAQQDAQEPPNLGDDTDTDYEGTETLDAEEVPTVPDSVGNVYVHKMRVDCGPGCGGCPHGPYKYLKYWDGDRVRTRYAENTPLPALDSDHDADES